MKQYPSIQFTAIIIADIIVITRSLYLSLYLSFLSQVPDGFAQNLHSILLPTVLVILSIFHLLGLYRQKWYCAGFLGLIKLAFIVIISLLPTYLYSLYLGLLPSCYFLIVFVLLILYIGSSRLLFRHFTYTPVDHKGSARVICLSSLKRLVNSICQYLFNTSKHLFVLTREHKELTLIVFVSFMMRLLLADWNSYWLDELYSVFERGIALDSSIEVLKYHQNRHSPMPLYEFILFNWMTLFGHTEVITRTLSSLYVALSTIFLYLLTIKTFSRRIAIASTLLYSFSYMAIYYALEARYYGQMLFLCVLSSYLLFVYLENITNHFSLEQIIFNKYYFLLSVVNVAVMLTFSFNYLFLAAQGVFVITYFIYLNRSEGFFKNVFYATSIYVIQVALMVILWGPYIFRSLIKPFYMGIVNGSNIDTGIVSSYRMMPFKNPLAIFVDNVISPNLEFHYLEYLALFLLISVIFIKYFMRYYRRSINGMLIIRKFYFFYIIAWLIVPSILVYVIFTLGQLDKLQPRYLIFCTPPLMVILALSIEQSILIISKVLKRLFEVNLLRHYVCYATVYALIATIILVIPGGYKAAINRKADWRGIAELIVEQVHRDPGHTYVVVETTFREPYTLNYYFERFSEQVRVSARITRGTEMGLNDEDSFLANPTIFSDMSLSEIEKHDYLIIAFTHHTVSHFPKVLDILSEEYELLFSVLNDSGRGYLVYNPIQLNGYADD